MIVWEECTNRIIQSSECLSLTPASAGPTIVLLTLWQLAQRLVKINFPSSTGGIEKTYPVNKDIKIEIAIFFHERRFFIT